MKKIREIKRNYEVTKARHRILSDLSSNINAIPYGENLDKYNSFLKREQQYAEAPKEHSKYTRENSKGKTNNLKDKKRNPLGGKANKSVKQHDIEKWLIHQRILNRADVTIIKGLAKNGEVVDYKADEIIVRQGDIGDSAFFILYGSVSVVVNGKKVAIRQAKECIGEMTMLDPTQKRSATLIAQEESRLLKVQSDKFRAYIEKDATILEGIALESASRLREHTNKITRGNERPKVFIGSSKEYFEVAKRLAQKLPSSDDIQPVHWKDGVFELSKSNIESLCAIADASDFGVFILSKDDLTKSRGKKCASPRDNVLFEFGLFMGNLGRDRTYAICCGANLKLPSDLQGMAFATLDYTLEDKGKFDLSECVKQIRAEILKKGVR